MLFHPCDKPLTGTLTVPGDKSISHRSVMFGALSEGRTEVTHFLKSADCLSTIDCFCKMGIQIEETDGLLTIHGKGLHGLSAPKEVLNTGNSGTTTRLISGILAGQTFTSHLIGDASICKRPMGRIIKPLSLMGADIVSDRGNDCVPLTIKGHTLKALHYTSPVASAQVKSCILLAGLYADGPVSVTEPALSRNHSELMLSSFGARVESHDLTATIYPDPILEGQQIAVPGDISSAAYFIAAALMVPGSDIVIKNVGVNPTRDGILKVVKAMGADIEYLSLTEAAGEKTADLRVRYTPGLKGTVIEGAIIPTLIDEIPMIAVLASVCEGTTVIRDAAELKVKESDRLSIMVESLSAMGVDITGTEDGMIINGGRPLKGAAIDSHLDHRIAMSFAIASLVAEGPVEIKDAQCVNISYPEFYEDLASLF